jgi:hypothetical protein
VKKFGLVALMALVSLPSFAQDIASVTHNHKVQFENEFVRVVRIHYDPHEKVADFEHNWTSGFYVYLNDHGPLIFDHRGQRFGRRERPFTPAGSLHIAVRYPETHQVENPTDKPADYVRVEFKTDGTGVRYGGDIRINREEYPANQNFEKIQYENSQIRIARMVVAPGKQLDVSTTVNEPALLLALTPGALNGGKHQLALGDHLWVAEKQQQVLENTGGAAVEFVRFEFKTRPLTKAELDKSKAEFDALVAKAKAAAAAVAK